MDSEAVRVAISEGFLVIMGYRKTPTSTAVSSVYTRSKARRYWFWRVACRGVLISVGWMRSSHGHRHFHFPGRETLVALVDSWKGSWWSRHRWTPSISLDAEVVRFRRCEKDTLLSFGKATCKQNQIKETLGVTTNDRVYSYASSNDPQQKSGMLLYG